MKKQREKLLRALNPSRKLKSMLKEIVARAVDTDEAHEALSRYQRRSASATPLDILNIRNEDAPYAGIAQLEFSRPAHDNAVILTSRFRSGSTALWNAFRVIDDITAYYEPFNERQFFDPAQRGTHVDATHLGVADYAAEYDNTSGLKELYDVDWVKRDLFMGKNAWNPRMRQFIDRLIECSSGRPVMQFNRIDFRLPWIRRHFPEAQIVHLYRHPREQWCSFLIDIHEFPRDVHPSEFSYRFYLDLWARDLQHVMPFLRMEEIQHPYQLFYYIWKMSYLFGRHYASQSISYEELATSPEKTLSSLLNSLNMEASYVDRMSATIKPPKCDRWPDYANPEWFEYHEKQCEVVLTEFLGTAGFEDFDNFTPPTNTVSK